MSGGPHDIAAGTVTVTLSDYVSGVALGQWTSPSIAPGTAQQYSIATLEGALPAFGAKPALYSATMQAQFDGTFQHVLWKPGDGTLTNLSTCGTGVTIDTVADNNGTVVEDLPFAVPQTSFDDAVGRV